MGGDVVGGINSKIARLMKISLRNLKLGRGKHTTQTKRVKYSCARKQKLAVPSPKNAHNENFAAKLETWARETHNGDEARKILVCEKTENW